MCNLGSSPGQGYCIRFFDKTLYSHRTSVHPDAGQNTNPVVTTVASHLGRVELVLVASVNCMP